MSLWMKQIAENMWKSNLTEINYAGNTRKNPNNNELKNHNTRNIRLKPWLKKPLTKNKMGSKQ